MSESMSNLERVLWRIAELGARCSQNSAAGGRGPLWAELEQTIASLEADLEAARQANDIAPAQVRSLEGRLSVAKKERDRERLRADECQADAEAARRERDRERQRAIKARQATDAARAAASDCLARVAAAETARDHALTALDKAVNAHEQTVNALDHAVAARDEAVASRDNAVASRDDAVAARDDAVAARDQALARVAELNAALEAARIDSETVDTLAARAEGAVVVLPGVALPEAPAAPSAERVSWKPTWSEWANDAAATEEPAAVDQADTADDEIDLQEMPEGATRRYLNVAATIGQLLPEDLGPLLLSGATVVRREGRLFATVAVTTNPWKSAGPDGEHQAQKFADAGLRVEWTSVAPLAC